MKNTVTIDEQQRAIHADVTTAGFPGIQCACGWHIRLERPDGIDDRDREYLKNVFELGKSAGFHP